MNQIQSAVKSEKVPRAAGTVSDPHYVSPSTAYTQTPSYTTPGRRRKIKCEYGTSGSETCIPCNARDVTCISQEYDDADLKAPPVDRRLGQRLSRLEQMMETLANGYPPPESSATGRGGGALGFKQTDLEAVEDDLLDSAVKNAQEMAIGYTKPAEHANNLPTPGSSAASTSAAANPYQVSAQLRTQRHKQVSE